MLIPVYPVKTYLLQGQSSRYEGVQVFYIYYFYSKPYVVGSHYNCLDETILMSTHNIGFGRE